MRDGSYIVNFRLLNTGNRISRPIGRFLGAGFALQAQIGACQLLKSLIIILILGFSFISYYLIASLCEKIL